MKRIIIAAVTACMCILLVGCTGTSSDMPLFVYAFGCDAKKDGTDGVILYVVAEKEDSENEKSESSQEGGSKGGSSKNEKGSENTSQSNFTVYEYDGKSIAEVFDKFFEEHKDAYTGTVKEYIVGEGLGNDGLYDFKVYLTNSPRLPVKEKTLMKSDAAGYLYENLYRLTK